MKILVAVFFILVLIIVIHFKIKKNNELKLRNQLIKEEAEKVLSYKKEKKLDKKLSMDDLSYLEGQPQEQVQDKEEVSENKDLNLFTILKSEIASFVKPDEIKVVKLEEQETQKPKKEVSKPKEIIIQPVPDIAKKNNDLGVEAFKKKEYDKSIAMYKDAVNIAPQYTLAHYNMGNTYYEMGIFDKALDCYQKVIDINPSDQFSYYNIAMSYYKKEDFKSAVEYYNKAVSISPGDYSVHYNLGKVFEKMEKYDEAISAYQKSVDLNSEYANAHYNLAEIYKLKGLYSKAVYFYEMYLRCNPKASDNMDVKKLIMHLRGMY